MTNKKSSCVVAKGKPGSILAGLLWHPVLNEDPVLQERSVYEFSQAYETDVLVVAGNDHCLQIGFPQGKSFRKDNRKSGSLYAMASLARLLFQNRNGFLVWVLEKPEEFEEVSVCLIEQDLIVLDVLLSLQDAKNLVETYLADQSRVEVFGLVSNDINFLPSAELIDDFYLFGRVEQRCLLRKPRKPRNILAAKRTRKDVLKLLSYGAAIALIIFGMNMFYQKKKAEMLNRIKKTETAKYFDELKAKTPAIGLGYKGISVLQARLATYPLIFEGWQLDSIKCDSTGCTSRWSGQAGWSKKPLEAFGKEVDASKDKTKRNPSAVGFTADQVQYLQAFDTPLEGVLSSEEMINLKEVADFCDRERLLLSFGTLKWSCDTKGEPWPVKPKATIERGLVTEHKITVQGSVAMIDYVVKRYKGQIFWKEFSILGVDEKGSKSKFESDFMQFQLTGAVYAKN